MLAARSLATSSMCTEEVAALWDCCFGKTRSIYPSIYLSSSGDAVVYGADTATLVIEANDEANGIFSLEPIEKPVEEGKTNSF